jgi:Sugar kinases, ribokinase family
MSSNIILVGEPMGLFIAQSEGPLESVTGYSCAVAGAEFNVAVGMSRLEHKVAYMTKLGSDPFGKLIVNVLDKNKIGTGLVSWSKDRSTGFMLKSRVSKGDPEIFYFRKNSAASTMNKEDVDMVDFSGYSNLHMTGIFPALSPSTREAAYYLMEKAKKSGITVSFDPNLRPQLWSSKKEMVRVINDLALKCDILFPGIAEGITLTGKDTPEEICKFYLDMGVKTVVLKLGAKGAYVAAKDGCYTVKGFTVEKIVDTVGAGDGFAVGVISALMEGLSLKEAAVRGNAIGAIQVMSIGDNDGLPTREELSKYIQKNS